MSSTIPPSAITSSRASVRSRLGEEEVEPTEQPVELVSALSDRLADLARQRSRRASPCRARSRSRNRRSPRCALGAGALARRSAPARARASLVLHAPGRDRRPRASGASRLSRDCGSKKCSSSVGGRLFERPRPAEIHAGSARRRAERRRPRSRCVELGVPLDAATQAVGRSSFDRLDDVGRAPTSASETFTPRPSSLDRLVVDRVHVLARGASYRPASKPRARTRSRGPVLLVDRPVAVGERAGDLRADVLVERAAERDVDHLRAAADPEHRLARVDERAQQADLVVVADRGRRSTRAGSVSSP
jgi:hypothetical protein